MPARQNILAIIRSIKNYTAATTAGQVSEQVLLELDYNQGSLLRTSALIEKINLASLVSGTVALTTQLPANARVLFAGIQAQNAVTLLTTTNAVSLGTTGSNSAFYTSPAGSAIASAFSELKPVSDVTGRNGGTALSNVVLAITNNAGATAGTNNTGTGSIKACIIFQYPQAIAA